MSYSVIRAKKALRSTCCQCLTASAAITPLRYITTHRHIKHRIAQYTTHNTILSHTRQFASAAQQQNNKDGNPNKFAIQLHDLTKRLGSVGSTGRNLFKNVTLSFYDGAKIGIVGVNGSGKSSLMRIIGGIDKNYDGTCTISDGMVVGFLQQEPVLDDTKTVLETIMEGVSKQTSLLKQYEDICAAFGDENTDFDKLTEQQSAIQELIDRYDAWNLDYKIQQSMQALRCAPSDSIVGTLSGGEKRRVALCRLLLQQPDILLLDEPTNHLDALSVQWLEQFLAQYKGLVLAITHDRYFLDNVAGYILELDAGQCIPFHGNYAMWLEQKSKRLATEKKQNAQLQKLMQKELLWLRQGVSAQRAKNKARVNKFAELNNAVQEKRLNQRSEGGALVIPEGPRLGNDVISVNNVSYVTSDTGETIFKDISFELKRGDMLGIIGCNGSGKTTLLKCITGERQVNTGSMKIGDTVVFGYNSQTREKLNDDNMVWQEIVGGRAEVQVSSTLSMPARAYVAQFNFSGQDQQKRIHSLSGGERNRVHLAKSMINGCNVIILDEPTNDLDVDTLRALEDAMCEFDGTGIIVSHDRYFIDRICTHVLVFDDTIGKTIFFDGNYTEYERHKRDVLGIESKKQQRFKNISLTG